LFSAVVVVVVVLSSQTTFKDEQSAKSMISLTFEFQQHLSSISRKGKGE